MSLLFFFFFSSRRRHTRCLSDWSSDVCSSDLKSGNSFQFPDFDDDLRRAMVHEVELFFKSIMDEDRNVLDLMTADFTFVNERLAKHYGMPDIYGSQFRRVTVSDARRGLLGKGAILM